MKQLHITIGDTVIQFADAEHAGPIVAGLASARLVKKDWDGAITEIPEGPTFQFVDPETTMENPAVAALKKEVEQYRKWWSDENTKSGKLEATIRAMQAQLNEAPQP